MKILPGQLSLPLFESIAEQLAYMEAVKLDLAIGI